MGQIQSPCRTKTHATNHTSHHALHDTYYHTKMLKLHYQFYNIIYRCPNLYFFFFLFIIVDTSVCKIYVYIIYTYPGAEPSRCLGRGWPGIHSADMVKRDEALAPTLGRGVAVANLDFEEERTDGKAVVAMPQLINVLAAICLWLKFCVFGDWRGTKERMNECGLWKRNQ